LIIGVLCSLKIRKFRVKQALRMKVLSKLCRYKL